MASNRLHFREVQKNELSLLYAIYPDLLLSVKGLSELHLAEHEAKIPNRVYPLYLKFLLFPPENQESGHAKKNFELPNFKVILTINCDKRYPTLVPKLSFEEVSDLEPTQKQRLLAHLHAVAKDNVTTPAIVAIIEAGREFLTNMQEAVRAKHVAELDFALAQKQKAQKIQMAQVCAALERRLACMGASESSENSQSGDISEGLTMALDQRRPKNQSFSSQRRMPRKCRLSDEGKDSIGGTGGDQVSPNIICPISRHCGVSQLSFTRPKLKLRHPLSLQTQGRTRRRSTSDEFASNTNGQQQALPSELSVVRGHCSNGPHVLPQSVDGVQRPFPCRAQFPAFDVSTGHPLQIDEWVFEARCVQSHATNQIVSRFTYCARLPAHANLAKVHTISVLRDVPPSGEQIAGDWTGWYVVSIVSQQPKGMPLTTLVKPLCRDANSLMKSTEFEKMRVVTSQILTALLWLLHNSMSHRNLQPNKIFVDGNYNVQLTEYEFYSRFDDYVDKVNSKYGTSRFVSTVQPFRRKFRSSHQKDIYHLGVILLFWVTQTPPDHVDATGQPAFSPALQSMLDQAPAFKDFLQSCLSERGESAEKLLNHPFLKEPLHLTPKPGCTHETDDNSGRKPSSNGVTILSSKPDQLVGNTPRLFTDFEDFSVIGRGGFGCVLRARNIIENREYAIKAVRILHSQAETILREVRTLSSLQHENIVRYFTSWKDEFLEPLPHQSMPWSLAALKSVGEVPSTLDEFEEEDKEEQEEPDSSDSTSWKTVTRNKRTRRGQGEKMYNHKSGTVNAPVLNLMVPEDSLVPTSGEENVANGLAYKKLASTEVSWADLPTDNLGTPKGFYRQSSAEDCSSAEENSDSRSGDGEDETDREAGGALSSTPALSRFHNSSVIIFKSLTSSSSSSSELSDEEETRDSTDSGDDSSENSSNCVPDRQQKTTLQYIIIQMELCAGKTLQKVIDQENLSANPDRAWSLFRELTDALAYIHSKGVIHRDLKPSNVMLDAGDHVKIGDFGLAIWMTRHQAANVRKEVSAILKMSVMGKNSELSSVTTSALASAAQSYVDLQQQKLPYAGNLMENRPSHASCGMTENVGTYLYMSPEILSERPARIVYDEKVDLYSLGIILFEMFYKSMPTLMERVAVLTEIRKPKIAFPKDWDCDLLVNQTGLVRSLLQHDASGRPSASDLLASPLVPPLKSTESAFRKQVLDAFNNPEGNLYRFIANNLLTVSCSRAADYLYDRSTSLIHRNFASPGNRGARIPGSVGMLLNTEQAQMRIVIRFQLLQRHIVRYLESIFAVHCAIPIQPPTLIPVSKRSTATWLNSAVSSRLSTTYRTPSTALSESGIGAGVDGSEVRNRLAGARVMIGGPIFLDAEGVPVSLPDALHVGLARYIAHIGISNFRSYQLGKVYAPWPRPNPFRAVDHPIESNRASFDVVSPKYLPHTLVEILQVLSEITKIISVRNVTFMLYINHTDLLESMFKLVGVPSDLRVSLWRRLASASDRPQAYPPASQASPSLPHRHIQLPDLLTSCGRSHAQRCLTKLTRLETRRGDVLKQAFSDASVTKAKEDVKEKITRACNRLQDIISTIEQLKAVSNFNVVMTPGLVLPCHLYQGIIFQLAVYSIHGQFDQIETMEMDDDGLSGARGIDLHNPDNTIVASAISHRKNRPVLSRTSTSVTAGPTSANSTKLLVLASGGEYQHLIYRFKPPSEFRMHAQPDRRESLHPTLVTPENARTDLQQLRNHTMPTLYSSVNESTPSVLGTSINIDRLVRCLLVASDNSATSDVITAQFPEPFHVDTSLCHVVVTWEMRPIDVQSPSISQLLAARSAFLNTASTSRIIVSQQQQNTAQVVVGSPRNRVARKSSDSFTTLPQYALHHHLHYSNTSGAVSASEGQSDHMAMSPPSAGVGLAQEAGPCTNQSNVPFSTTTSSIQQIDVHKQPNPFAAGLDLAPFGFPATSFVDSKDPLQLAYQLVCSLWAAGVSAQIVPSATSDVIEAATDMAAEFSVRVCLAALPQGLAMITYKIWKLSGTGLSTDLAAFPVFAGEPVRCCQPDVVVSFILQTLNRCSPRRPYGDGSLAGGGVCGASIVASLASNLLQQQQQQQQQSQQPPSTSSTIPTTQLQQSQQHRTTLVTGPSAGMSNLIMVAGDGPLTFPNQPRSSTYKKSTTRRQRQRQ